jgi:polyisoprenoid-binding protein YceI
VQHDRARSLDPARPTRVGLGVAILALAAVLGLGAATQGQDAGDPAAEDGIDGTWVVNTEIGSFEGTDEAQPYSSSWVGFRVAEELRGVGAAEAVGRTPVVDGSLTAAGSVIESARIEVDLTTITSDRAQRDPWIQDALETERFPTATFEVAGPVDLGAVPADGEPFTASLPGTLTIRGIEQPVELELTGQRTGELVVVVGTLPVDFTAFDVTMPVLGPVLSVEDAGDLEWLLWLERDGPDG